jgi:hypothetical protein
LIGAFAFESEAVGAALAELLDGRASLPCQRTGVGRRLRDGGT